jgi:hypothetical protein
MIIMSITTTTTITPPPPPPSSSSSAAAAAAAAAAPPLLTLRCGGSAQVVPTSVDHHHPDLPDVRRGLGRRRLRLLPVSERRGIKMMMRRRRMAHSARPWVYMFQWVVLDDACWACTTRVHGTICSLALNTCIAPCGPVTTRVSNPVALLFIRVLDPVRPWLMTLVSVPVRRVAVSWRSPGVARWRTGCCCGWASCTAPTYTYSSTSSSGATASSTGSRPPERRRDDDDGG